MKQSTHTTIKLIKSLDDRMDNMQGLTARRMVLNNPHEADQLLQQVRYLQATLAKVERSLEGQP